MTEPLIRGLSIAIPTFNRARILRRTLDSLSRVEIPDGLAVELLVINNNCTDDTPAAVAEFGRRVPFRVREVIEPGAGLNVARNRALDEAQFDHVIYFDDDVQIAPGWIRAYLEAERDFQADCVVGPVTPDFETAPPRYLAASVLEAISSGYSRKGDQMMRMPRKVAHQIPGCNFGVRKTTAIDIGRFKPELDRKAGGLVAGGDTEFGRRLSAAGKCVVYQPLCAVAHLISKEKMSRDYLRRRWYGNGVTIRILGGEPATLASPVGRARAVLSIARRFAAAAGLRLLGQSARAFELELDARQALGYFRGR